MFSKLREDAAKWWQSQGIVVRGVIGANAVIALNVYVLITLVSIGSDGWRAKCICAGALLAASVTGTCIGWLAGAALSPVNPVERGQFAEYLKAITSVLTGAVLLKLLEKLPAEPFNAFSLPLPVVVGICLFVAHAALGLITNYAFRTYHNKGSKGDGTSTESKPPSPPQGNHQ